MKTNLLNLFQIKSGDLVTVTGGGGKTSLLFYLAEELQLRQIATGITTTTKMYYPRTFKGNICTYKSEAIKQYPHFPLFFLYEKKRDDNKVTGLLPDQVDHLHHSLRHHVILCEADGAKQMPYKFYAEDEPVIPQTTSKIIHVIGSDVIGLNTSELIRCPVDKSNRPFDLMLFKREMEFFSEEKIKQYRCPKILFINKSEGKRTVTAEKMADLAGEYFDHCIIGSIKERTGCEWLSH